MKRPRCKTMSKVYDLNSDKEPNGDFEMEEHGGDIGNSNKEKNLEKKATNKKRIRINHPI